MTPRGVGRWQIEWRIGKRKWLENLGITAAEALPQPELAKVFLLVLRLLLVFDGLQWRKTGLGPCLLALLVAGLHANAIVWASRIDGASIVGAKEGAGMARAARQRNDFAKSLLKLRHHFIDRLARKVWIGIDKPRFAHNVQVFGLNDQVALAASSALIAFELGHNEWREGK